MLCLVIIYEIFFHFIHFYCSIFHFDIYYFVVVINSKYFYIYMITGSKILNSHEFAHKRS